MKKISSCLVSVTFAVLATSAMAQESRGERPRPPTFIQLDTNGDGGVSSAEFSTQRMPPGMDAGTLFNEIDANGDGVLSESEVAGFEPAKPPARN